MLIRSQDRKVLVNMDNIESISISSTNSHTWRVVSSSECIGEYSTEQNAIEVLSMICSAYDDYANRGLEKCWVRSVFVVPQDDELLIS